MQPKQIEWSYAIEICMHLVNLSMNKTPIIFSLAIQII